MRTLLKFTLDIEAANEAAKNGTLAQTIKRVLDLTKAEAAYFSTLEETRTGLIFFDMKESSEIPPIGEILFHELKAKVSFVPVMNIAELQKGLEQTAKSNMAGVN